MVLFILFPGNGMSEKNWEIYDESGKIKKTSFLKQLKKLGKVYKYTPNVNNIINYYNNSWKLRKKFYINKLYCLFCALKESMSLKKTNQILFFLLG